MDWRARLRELTLAGGTVALAASMSGCIPGCGTCNANPDPCCSEPSGTECAAEKACWAEGGVADYYPVDDLGREWMYGCRIPQDLAAPDLTVPLDLAGVRDGGSGD